MADTASPPRSPMCVPRRWGGASSKRAPICKSAFWLRRVATPPRSAHSRARKPSWPAIRPARALAREAGRGSTTPPSPPRSRSAAETGSVYLFLF